LLSRNRAREIHDQRESEAVKQKSSNNNLRTVVWDAKTFSGWQHEFENATVVINMAGRSVDCRYNQKNKDLIMNSRVDSTTIIGRAIAQCEHPP